MPIPKGMSREDDIVHIKYDGDSCSIHKFGATVISWKVNGQEKLFVSSKAIWDGSKPIRGGIPLVFPQFGTGTIMAGQHGFARNELWTVHEIKDDKVIFILKDNPKTKAAWPNSFKLTYTVQLTKGQLTISLQVINENLQDEFKFTSLFHTYFGIEDVSNVKVEGFHGLTYADKLKGGSQDMESRSLVSLEGEVDRNYFNAPDRIILHSGDSKLEIFKKGFPDVVLWNPWIEKSKAMADFDDLEYKKMVCIEVGQVASPISLSPGQSWAASQSLRSL